MKTPDIDLPEGVERHFGETPESVAQSLAVAVAAFLRQRLVSADRVSLVVSGGSTPVPFFAALSEQELDWERVDVLLADERWVEEDDPASNTRVVRERLLTGQASAARFLPLKRGGRTPVDGLAEVLAGLQGLTLPLDVVILGMGNDGHTASLFPDAPELARGMNALLSELVVAMTPPSQPHPRISLSRPVLGTARFTALHLKGRDKLETLQRALSDTDDVLAMPIRAFLKPGLQVFWSP
ncbi:6-phosphogluconolactonase [Marinobacter salinisoli]|uniref:6-phosphogluconolactonase n=1 Tax=Marinobacter salinisoli TaxID=2769486 RepID=A0ABX7MQ74_9GAMM|nr:6-phosphogluconolactonase [Marinobacter salinisoli]QSP93539.1 6-phosphogluconolactonase [Marinobacter salinisoli]